MSRTILFSASVLLLACGSDPVSPSDGGSGDSGSTDTATADSGASDSGSGGDTASATCETNRSFDGVLMDDTSVRVAFFNAFMRNFQVDTIVTPATGKPYLVLTQFFRNDASETTIETGTFDIADDANVFVCVADTVADLEDGPTACTERFDATGGTFTISETSGNGEGSPFGASFPELQLMDSNGCPATLSAFNIGLSSPPVDNT